MHSETPQVSVTLTRRISTLTAVILPFLALLVAIYGFWGWGFSWVELILLVVMYIMTGLGVTIGYHRLFTHRSFETVWPMKVALAVMGSMAVEGPLFHWVGTHRRHHQHSDKVGDPHSPHLEGTGGPLRSWWHAHVGWIFKADTFAWQNYVGDLQRDPTLVWISRWFPLWVALGLLLPAAAGGAITGTWRGALLGFLWGGLVRVFLVHHATWSINSVCHIWGSRPYARGDHSRNNFVFGILGFGEGWHNNHHAFPNSARHGLRWWQIDVSYMLICVMKALRLAWRVRVPAPEEIHTRRNPMGLDLLMNQPQS